ncbi:hypothetical protein V8C35DRAFT_89237 [Trichoderma chlorosporum]
MAERTAFLLCKLACMLLARSLPLTFYKAFKREAPFSRTDHQHLIAIISKGPSIDATVRLGGIVGFALPRLYLSSRELSSIH